MMPTYFTNWLSRSGPDQVMIID